MAVADSGREAPKVAFYNDPRGRGALYQIALIATIVFGGAWLIYNAVRNLAAQGKNMGFDFLWRPAGFDIGFKLIPFDRASYYWDVFLVGLTNTLLVSLISIAIATVLGFFLGIARLSKNWIVAKIALVYVEVTRNIPLLLWLFVWYFAVLKVMPPVKQSLSALGGTVFINQRGVFIPKLVTDGAFGIVYLAIAIAIIAAIGLRFWAKRRLDRTGQRFPVFFTALAVIVILPLLAYFMSGTQPYWELPELKGFNFKGGIDLPPELTAMILGLSLYTATFIGEIVRSGIQAVSHGQTEAAYALGLKDGDRLRLVVLPQALRVIIPPLSSEYLSLTKNSSLGAAIGYPELVNVFAGTALNQTGKAIEIIVMTMLVYLIFSLLTSAFMNWFNARVALVER